MEPEQWMPKIELVNDYLRKHKTQEEFDQYQVDEDDDDIFLISCGPYYHSAYNDEEESWINSLPFNAALADEEYLQEAIKKISSWPQLDLSNDEIVW
jgi:hypothetical protein